MRRIMPIEFTCNKSQLTQYTPPPRTLIISRDSMKLGSLLNRNGFYGIASLTLKSVKLMNEYSMESNNLFHENSGLRMRTWKPEWWPQSVNQIYLPQVDYPFSLFNIIP